MCPTRWLCRLSNVKEVLNKFELILDSLEEAKDSFGLNTSRSSPSTVYNCLASCKTILGLEAAILIQEIFERLNRSLQSSSETVDGMREKIQLVLNEIE